MGYAGLAEAVSEHCGAVRRGHSSRHGRSGDTCRKPAGWGTDHVGLAFCRLHGGNTATHRQSVEVAVAERALTRLGLPVPTDPIAALSRAVAAANGLHLGLEQLVREAATSEDSRALVPRLAMYADSVDRLARVARSAVDASLTERQAAPRKPRS